MIIRNPIVSQIVLQPIAQGFALGYWLLPRRGVNG